MSAEAIESIEQSELRVIDAVGGIIRLMQIGQGSGAASVEQVGTTDVLLDRAHQASGHTKASDDRLRKISQDLANIVSCFRIKPAVPGATKQPVSPNACDGPGCPPEPP